mmetsp:Transcript_66892/g.193274  ORF Transcript_66892/g.193274 Transcript_66892/m.193274 type:complete len:301 (+) Transcript_66892:81-983(+)
MMSKMRLVCAAAVTLSTCGQPLSVVAGEVGSSLAERALSADAQEHRGNPCKRKPDGWRCAHDVVVECSGGRTVSNETCAFYQDCKEGWHGPGTASCEEDACKRKADGFHCSDDHVVQCSGLVTVNYTACAFHQECERDRLQLNMAACVEDICERKADGFYCEDDHVVECRGQVTVNATKCGITEECKKHALGRYVAACVEDDCRGKPDGKYCEHDGVVECRGEVSVGFSKCPFYQECEHGWQGGVRMAACQEDACEHKRDGRYCKGDHVVVCAGFVTVDIEVCPDFEECEEGFGATAACI